MRIELAQTTFSERPKHPDDDPAVCASSISCLKLSLITLRIDPYVFVYSKTIVCVPFFARRNEVFVGGCMQLAAWNFWRLDPRGLCGAVDIWLSKNELHLRSCNTCTVHM
jgi:hypothetical protein